MKSLINAFISLLTSITLVMSMLGITFSRTTKGLWDKAYEISDQRYQITYQEDSASLLNSKKSIEYNRDCDTVYYKSSYSLANSEIVAVEQYYSKEDSVYYSYTKNIKGVWSKVAVTEQQYNKALGADCLSDFRDVFKYDDFTYDSDSKIYKADKIEHIVSDSQTDTYKNVSISFMNNRITNISATLLDGDTEVTKTITVAYKSLAITLPTVTA